LEVNYEWITREESKVDRVAFLAIKKVVDPAGSIFYSCRWYQVAEVAKLKARALTTARATSLGHHSGIGSFRRHHQIHLVAIRLCYCWPDRSTCHAITPLEQPASAG